MNPDAGPYEALYSNEQSLMGKGASKSYCKRNIKYVTLNEPYMKTYQTTLKCKRWWNLNKNIKKKLFTPECVCHTFSPTITALFTCTGETFRTTTFTRDLIFSVSFPESLLLDQLFWNVSSCPGYFGLLSFSWSWQFAPLVCGAQIDWEAFDSF